MFENERNIFDNDLLINLKNENGNSIVEATFVVTITLFMLATIIMLGFYHYQITLLQTVADEVSTQIARTYSYKKKDPLTGFISKDHLADKNITEASYWVLGDVNILGAAEGPKNQIEEDEAEKLTKQLLSNRRFMAAYGETKIDVDIQHSELVLFQNEVRVTVSEEYYIPFAKFLGAQNSILKVSKSSKALCFDVVGANGYYQTLMEIANFFGKSEVAKMVQNLTGIFKNVINAGKNLATVLFNGIN